MHSRTDTPSILDVASLRLHIDHIDDFNEKTYEAARWYAKNGFMIVPFKAGYPKGLSQVHATKNLKKIDEWWNPATGRHPGYMIAMAHGGQSGLCAVDLDIKGEINGVQNLVDLQMAYGSYSDSEGEGLQTLMASTPSGGRHLVFKYHPEIISNSEVTYPGIDTRGGLKKNPLQNGGITFVEPSKKPNTEGNYRWDDGVIEIIDFPQWLVDVLNGRTVKKNGGIQLQDAYIQSAPGDHGDGRDRNIYVDLLRFAGVGYSEEQLWALMPDILERMDPPDEDMVRRKIESAIASDVFIKATDEKETKKQVSGLSLTTDEKDRPFKSTENLATILSWPVFEHEYGLIQFDDFGNRFVRNKESMNSVSNWAVGIQLWISQKLKLDFPVTTIREMVEYIAYEERPHINVARDYMLSCPAPQLPVEDNFWQSGRAGPGPAFKRLCTEVLDLGNKDLHPGYDSDTYEAYSAFLWFWLQGVVARACVPGCKMEIVLNIFGGQGIGKSLFFRNLCPDSSWFTDSIQDSIAGGGQNNKDELLKLHAKIIVEMPELNPVKRGGKSGDDKMKQFISAQVDNFRDPYGHDSMDHPRSCALCGTSNDNDIYRDSSGARRFVSMNHADSPIRVGDLDNGVLKSIKNELWGEVVSSFNPGELDGLPDSLMVAIPPLLRTLQSDVNTEHKFEEIGINEVVEWMQDKTRVTWEEIIYFSRSIPGLRDSKESIIIGTVRKELKHDKMFIMKKRITLTDDEGNVKKVSRAWVNMNLDIEKNHKAGLPVPPHWSSYSGVREEGVTEY